MTIKGDVSEFGTAPAAQKYLTLAGANSSSEEEDNNGSSLLSILVILHIAFTIIITFNEFYYYCQHTFQ